MKAVKSIFGGSAPKQDTSALDRQEARIEKQAAKTEAETASRRAVIAAQQAGSGNNTLNAGTGFAGVTKDKFG